MSVLFYIQSMQTWTNINPKDLGMANGNHSFRQCYFFFCSLILSLYNKGALISFKGSYVAQVVKNLPAVQNSWV